jgi:hypothetical protein
MVEPTRESTDASTAQSMQPSRLLRHLRSVPLLHGAVFA